MNDKILISVIMPTYNSEKTIEASLKSIRRQEFDQSKVEILVVDGGSSDNTLGIARRYQTVILENKRRLPEFAKEIGFLQAKGRYAIYLDSDEMFVSRDSFQRRISFLQKHRKVKNLVSTGMLCKKGETGINRYANYIGDPFSNYVYDHFDGYNRLEGMKKIYRHVKTDGGYIFRFQSNTCLPLFDALGNMFDLKYAHEMYDRTGDKKNFAANIFYNLAVKSKCAAMLEDDFVIHQPGMGFLDYMEKLKWRIKNNLFRSEGVGFSAREKSEVMLSKRKYLFMLHNILVFPALAKAVRLSLHNRDGYFMMHFFISEILCFMIFWYAICKILHFPVNIDDRYGR